MAIHMTQITKPTYVDSHSHDSDNEANILGSLVVLCKALPLHEEQVCDRVQQLPWQGQSVYTRRAFHKDDLATFHANLRGHQIIKPVCMYVFMYTYMYINTQET